MTIVTDRDHCNLRRSIRDRRLEVFAVSGVGVREWVVERVGVDAVQPSQRNPRVGDLAVIKESLERNGQYRPIVVDRATGEVLAGNHTLMAARELGWSEVAAWFVEVDEETARRILLVDNRASDVASYNEGDLADLLMDVGADLSGTGYGLGDLSELLDSLAAESAVEDDDVPAAPADPVTKVGDLVVLGDHRLVCGDARDHASYASLLEGESADALVCDPPYGVSYEGRTKDRLRIAHDDEAGLPEL